MVLKKKILGVTYLMSFLVIILLLYFFEVYSKLNYEFFFSLKEDIISFKNLNFPFTIFLFFLFSVFWVFFLGIISPFLLLSSILFTPIIGTFVCLTGFTTGATLNYALSKYFFKDKVTFYLINKYPRLTNVVTTNNFRYFFLVRILPGVPFSVKNILGIVFNLNIKKFITATFFGEFPQIYLVLTLFHNFFKTFDVNKNIDWTFLYDVEVIIITLAYFVILLFADRLNRKILRENKKSR